MIIDADAHFTPFLESRGQSPRSWVHDYQQRKNGHFSVAETRLTELEILQVDRQVLNPMGPSLGLNYNLSVDIAPEIMALYNDTMLDIGRKYHQFDINIWLALQDIPASIREIYRVLDQSFFGLYVSDIPPYGFLQALDPVWKIINDHKIPWYMHLTNSDEFISGPDEKWQDLYATLIEKFNRRLWLVNIASMIAGETFDRYPELRVILAERDINWIPALISVFDDLRLCDPLPVLKKNFWFTIEPEMPDFISNSSLLGYDRLLFATDWPHDFDIGGDNSRHDVDTVMDLPLTPNQKNQILSRNFLDLKNRSRHL